MNGSRSASRKKATTEFPYHLMKTLYGFLVDLGEENWFEPEEKILKIEVATAFNYLTDLMKYEEITSSTKKGETSLDTSEAGRFLDGVESFLNIFKERI